jgi:hypothetical protein
MGGTLELPPHHQYYDSEQYLRIANKPGTGGVKGKGVSSGGAGGGKGESSPSVRSIKALPCHKDGLCIWHLAEKLGLKNRQGDLFTCRTPVGEVPFKHAQLSTVKLSKVKLLLQDTKFTAGADTLKTLILAEAVAKSHKFKAG